MAVIELERSERSPTRADGPSITRYDTIEEDPIPWGRLHGAPTPRAAIRESARHQTGLVWEAQTDDERIERLRRTTRALEEDRFVD
jgi:hypothetical protein